jgi:regulator-associated protein of mTOR
MRSANCSPISHPMLPPTHQHHMWYTGDPFKFNLFICLRNSIVTVGFAHCRDAWDMAAEICLAQLPTLIEDPNAEFQVCCLAFYLFLSVC